MEVTLTPPATLSEFYYQFSALPALTEFIETVTVEPEFIEPVVVSPLLTQEKQ